MLMIISTLRDSFTGEFEYLYNRIVLAGTYLTLIILFFIGHLFRTIIKVINPSHINKSMRAELLKEAKRILLESLFRQYCLNEYHATMKALGIEFNSLNVAFDIAVATSETDEQKDDPELKPRYVFDVNISKIKKEYSNKAKKAGKYYYSSLVIGKQTNDYDNFIWDYGKRNTEKERSVLKSCVILTDKELENETPATYREYFDQKLEDYSQSGKHKEVQNILEMYLELYDLQMQNTIHE
ncbi:hypothetical protein SAMN06265348_1361 [Pedobacter westerhofensis]|uniref:Uncharacterized protein n=1 Tax=Pedobacter westerhofensis TaxID=425512 RepID=A0A521FV90_9SPHI|nr:hypothetical protein [Pedobacter westerhofensis]SMP00098.1 hypothetical protein SAMN06265348_1361 [Pedobacter westerhofensis]